MKDDTKKSAPKPKVQIKDMAPKKDAKGGFSAAAAKTQAGTRAQSAVHQG